MPYTLWSRGRLLGESELDFAYRRNGWRCGWFQPADGAGPLIEIATGVSPAMSAMHHDAQDRTTQADVAAAIDRCEALELELRGPDGAVVPCDDICIRDSEYLLTLADSIDDDAWYESLDDDARAELDASVEHDIAIIEECLDHDAAAPWRPETELRRYQLQIQLRDHDDDDDDDDDELDRLDGLDENV